MKLHIGTTAHGRDFTLPLDLVTQTIAILAKKGAGKSYTASVMVEGLLEAGQVPVIIDPTGAWWGLKSSADGKSPAYPMVVFGGEHGDLTLVDSAGEATARAIVEQRFPAIIDLSLFRKGEVKRFITPFLETIYRLNRLPLMLVVDEADDICPQKPFGDEAQMVGALEDVVKRGRKKGIGCTLITQRPADLAKQVLTQCEMLVAMRLVHPLDIKAVMEWVNVHADAKPAAAMVESLPSLPIGTAWFWSPGWGDIFERVEVARRRTFDSGATPKAGEQAVTPKRMAQPDLTKLGSEIMASVERAKADDPKLLRAKIAQLERDARAVKQEPAVKVEVREVPILRETDGHKLVEMITLSKEVNERGAHIVKQLERLNQEIFDRIQSSRALLRPAITSAPSPRVGSGSAPKVAPVSRRNPSPDAGNGTGLSKCERAILTCLAQFGPCTKARISAVSGYSNISSSFNNALGALRTQRFISPAGTDPITLTQEGNEALGERDILPTGRELIAFWLAKLGKAEAAILRCVVEVYPNAISKADVAKISGYSETSSSFNNALGSLRTLELINRGQPIQASQNLF